MMPPFFLEELCRAAVEAGASDLLLHEGRVPRWRVAGRLLSVECPPLDHEFFDKLWEECAAGKAQDFDTSWVSRDGVRFRVNLLSSLGARGAVLRRIRSEIPQLEELGVPAGVLQEWAASRQGLLLVCGPAGSGKSTTLAAVLGWMNQQFERHVVTIEDPVEFVFEDQRCLFTQREARLDTASFSEGLRRLLRQNPDVILIGEIRDYEGAVVALQAAETGHLVLATLHAPTCVDVLDRLEGLIPAGERENVRKLLAAQLLGVLCQKLLPRIAGGLSLACEFFTNTGAARKYVAEGRRSELADWLARGDGLRARAMEDSLVALVRSGEVSEESALLAVENPQNFQRAMRGISSASAVTRR